MKNISALGVFGKISYKDRKLISFLDSLGKSIQISIPNFSQRFIIEIPISLSSAVIAKLFIFFDTSNSSKAIK